MAGPTSCPPISRCACASSAGTITTSAPTGAMSPASATARPTSPAATTSASTSTRSPPNTPAQHWPSPSPTGSPCAAASRGSSRCGPGSGAWVAATDALANERFIVAADLDGNRSSARVRIGAGIESADLIASLGDEVERQDVLEWDKQRDDLVVHETVRLGSMMLDEQYRPAPRGRGDRGRSDRTGTGNPIGRPELDRRRPATPPAPGLRGEPSGWRLAGGR